MTDTVYAAEFNDCIYESAFCLVSLHKTETGANKAIKNKKARVLREWKKVGVTQAPDYEHYRVRAIELKE